MKFAEQKTITSRSKLMKIENVHKALPSISFPKMKCDGCNRLLTEHLPWSPVWAIRLSDNVAGGYRLCCDCAAEALQEVQAC
jgi:hypothetical protein